MRRVSEPTAAIRVLIVDDEAPARRRLAMMLAEIGGVAIVGEASNGVEALEIAEALGPDLVLLDIEMPELDGIGVAARLIDGEKPPVVMFVTAFDHYAVQAFEHAAIDYLLKPVALERMEVALARVAVALTARQAAERVEAMAEVIATLRQIRPSAVRGEGHLREIWVQRRAERIRVEVARINWIEAEHDYVQLHLGERSYQLRQRISELEAALDPAIFVRIHRSAIVRRDAIQSVRQNGLGALLVLIADGTERRVGRKYAPLVRRMMHEIL